jgi:hypothetical protein
MRLAGSPLLGRPARGTEKFFMKKRKTLKGEKSFVIMTL